MQLSYQVTRCNRHLRAGFEGYVVGFAIDDIVKVQFDMFGLRMFNVPKDLLTKDSSKHHSGLSERSDE